MVKETVYTESEVTINGVTYRNLPAQVRRNQSLSEQASKDATGAAQGISEAKAAAAQALTTAQAAQSTAASAQTTATTAQNTANTAKSEAESATALANAAQEDATNAVVTAANAESLAQAAVRYDEVQFLSDAEKQQARSNIGVTEQGITIDDELSTTSENPVQNKAITAQINLTNANVTNAQNTASSASGAAQQALQNASTAQSRANVSVRFDTSQDMTAAQQKQARDNINAKANSFGAIIASNITSLNVVKTFNFDTTTYKNIYVEVLPKTGSAHIGCTIPVYALSSATKRYQLTDEVNYVSFNLAISGFSSTATLTYSMATRAQNSAVISYIMAMP